MCGIVGYVGNKTAADILLSGLKRLEYRGYDSAGLALQSGARLQVFKQTGKVSRLADKVLAKMPPAKIGIGHTRWATHGKPTWSNAHPQLSGGRVAVVHNGIVENYQTLKTQLSKQGHKFTSQTDTEVIAHLIHSYLSKGRSLKDATRLALVKIVGTFGLVVMDAQRPDQLVAARRGSPLLLGLGKGEMYIASDASAIVGYTDKIVYLEDDELAICQPAAYQLYNLRNHSLKREPKTIRLELSAIEKAGYEHFLLKEIMEQPEAVKNCLRGRLDAKNAISHLGGLNISEGLIKNVGRIITVGCGTAAYAGMLGKYHLERLLGIPVQVEIGSEFRYRYAATTSNDLALILSQSGETADTLASLRELKSRGVPTIGLINVVGSSVAREVDGGIYLHAGPEISVASTKAFTTQVVAQLLLGLYLARTRGMKPVQGKRLIAELSRLPQLIERTLKLAPQVKRLAGRIAGFDNSLYLGRDSYYPVALEGSHKVKEIAYVHAEAYPTGEMKHGVNALIDKNMLVVMLCPKDNLHAKSLSNLEEVRARGGTILALTTGRDRQVERLATHTLAVPAAGALTHGLLMNVVLQLLAYFVALRRGTDVDQPRNLAKSVTVE